MNRQQFRVGILALVLVATAPLTLPVDQTVEAAEVTHAFDRNPGTRYTTTSATFNLPNATYEIPAASLEASTEYFLVVTAQVGATDTSTADHEFRIEEVAGAGTLTASTATIEMRRGDGNTGHQYLYVSEFTTDATARDVEFQFRTPGASNTTHTSGVEIMMIKTADLAAGDHQFNEDTTNRVDVSSSAWVDTASVTLGAGDWACWGNAEWLSDTAENTDQMRMVLDLASTEYSIQNYDPQDTAETLILGTFAYVEGVSASTTAKFKVRTTADNHDVTNARIGCLNLDAFEDHFGIRDNTTNATLTVLNTLVEATADLPDGGTTTTAASREWVAYGAVIHDVNDSTRSLIRRMTYELDGGGENEFAGNTADPDISQGNGTTEELFAIIAGTIAGVGNGVALNIDLDIAEAYDVTPNSSMQDAIIAAWTWELAVAGGSVVPIMIDHARRRRQ